MPTVRMHNPKACEDANPRETLEFSYCAGAAATFFLDQFRVGT